MFTLNCMGRLLKMDQPVVMGIINTTPDSFFKGSRAMQQDQLLSQAEKMITEGATFLDIGGQSTRPGSKAISASEELDRVLPAIESLHLHFPQQLVSVDTYYSVVAREAVHAGASLVNDISAGSIDPTLIETVAGLRVPYVLMHMKGLPSHMQDQPEYENVVLEVFDQLNHRLHALTLAGIHDVIIDPGFGFGKTIAHNFRLLHHLSFFQQLGKPVLAGLSRKGTVYKTLGVSADEALNGTTVLHTMALLNGATILRSHDVKESMEAIQLFAAYTKEKEQ
jgi:dihydropteroate synthase